MCPTRVLGFEMIQRIQSIYIALGALFTGSVYCLDSVWSGSAAVESVWFTPVALGMYGLTVAGGLLAIFLYKDRSRQRQVVSSIRMVLFVGWVVVLAGEYIGGVLPFVQVGTPDSATSMVFALPLIGLVFFTLARRGIDRDIDLIRSVDRLR